MYLGDVHNIINYLDFKFPFLCHFLSLPHRNAYHWLRKDVSLRTIKWKTHSDQCLFLGSKFLKTYALFNFKRHSKIF